VTHLGLMVVFSACVAAVFAGVLRQRPRDQFAVGVRILGGLVLGAVLVGWALYGLFG